MQFSNLQKIFSKTEIQKLRDELKPLLFDNEKLQTDWYKEINLYVAYPDSFVDEDKPGLVVLRGKLQDIKEMGFNAIHILPIFESPMVDAGFDIADYMEVRDDLGGNKAFDELLEEANELDMKVFIDVVFNHISDQHEWFQKAISGDEKYRKYFFARKEKPGFIEKFEDKKGIWAKYKYGENIVDTRIIFPEQAGEIPHWKQQKDDYWYYHTFYPSQLDINWLNIDTFIEFAKILIYWANKGVSFRLDAFTFVGKKLETGETESTAATYLILEALHEVIKEANPESVFLIETCQELKVIQKYFGTETSMFAELAYNFPLMNEMWSSIIKGKSGNLYELINEASDVPNWAGWITFLRNHDELGLEFANYDDRMLILKSFEGKGLSFRKGFGFSGRTSSFLDTNPKRILMAYFLLVSFPGNPALIYGDEIGKENDFENMKTQLKMKHKQGHTKAVNDTRDINRGTIDINSHLDDEKAGLRNNISQIFNNRSKYIDFFNVTPVKVTEFEVVEDIVALKYTLKDEELLCLINLSEKSFDIAIDNSYEKLVQVNSVEISSNYVKFGMYAGVWLKRKL